MRALLLSLCAAALMAAEWPAGLTLPDGFTKDSTAALPTWTHADGSRLILAPHETDTPVSFAASLKTALADFNASLPKARLDAPAAIGNHRLVRLRWQQGTDNKMRTLIFVNVDDRLTGVLSLTAGTGRNQQTLIEQLR